MDKWFVAIAFSILLIPIGARNVLAATVTLDSDAIMTIGSDSTLSINSDDSNTLANQGEINIEEDGIINVGSGASSLTLLSNDGTINGPGTINLFGVDIDVQDNGIITAIINEFFSESPSVVGGEIIPIDNIALLLSSAQTSMIWWLPAVMIIGASIVLLKTKRNVKINE